jgi:hypothetical protein
MECYSSKGNVSVITQLQNNVTFSLLFEDDFTVILSIL